MKLRLEKVEEIIRNYGEMNFYRTHTEANKSLYTPPTSKGSINSTNKNY